VPPKPALQSREEQRKPDRGILSDHFIAAASEPELAGEQGESQTQNRAGNLA
jgi:hypothetical protein